MVKEAIILKYSFDDMINRIKTKKKEIGLTNKQLSELSGVPFGTLNKILGSETKEPSINAIIKISHALGVPTNYIISGIVENSSFQNEAIFSADEIQHIEKYRKLDTFGKKTIDTLLEIEYERCQISLS